MDITKLSKRMLHVLISKNTEQALLARGAGNETKAKYHDEIAKLISGEIAKR